MFVQEIKELFKKNGFKLCKGNRFMPRGGITNMTYKDTDRLYTIRFDQNYKGESGTYKVDIYLGDCDVVNNPVKDTADLVIRTVRLKDFIKLFDEVTDFHEYFKQFEDKKECVMN